MTEPQKTVRYITAEGRLTTEGILMLLSMFNRIKELEARVTALEP